MYPTVKVTGKSFVGVKRVTVPNQSMSLREIISRFVRREPLPVSKEGVYEDRFGDLEKLKREDITVQMERVERIKAQLSDIERRWKEREAAELKVRQDKATADALAQAQAAGAAASSAQPPRGS